MRKGFEYVDYVLLALIVLGIGYLIVRRRRGGPPVAGDSAGGGPAPGAN